MKCPHCNYKNGVDLDNKMKMVRGKHGSFYKLSNQIIMETMGKPNECFSPSSYEIYGCPKCMKLFMDI